VFATRTFPFFPGPGRIRRQEVPQAPHFQRPASPQDSEKRTGTTQQDYGSPAKKDGLVNHPFSHNLRCLSYFFLVFLAGFAAVFFVVPHAAPFDLQAITNLLHKKDNFKLTQSMRAVNIRTALPLADSRAAGI